MWRHAWEMWQLAALLKAVRSYFQIIYDIGCLDPRPPDALVRSCTLGSQTPASTLHPCIHVQLTFRVADAAGRRPLKAIKQCLVK